MLITKLILGTLLIMPLNSFSASTGGGEESCTTLTHCSEQCKDKNGGTRYGYFCMFGTVCNPLSHRCEKAEAKAMDRKEISTSKARTKKIN
jgi:hypothetical protein